MRLWDLRTPNCQAKVKCPGLPCCAFDQQALVFSVSSCCGVIKLFDSRGYDQGVITILDAPNCDILGPFATFAIKDENCSVIPFSSLKFSYDGQKILAVNESTVYVIEAFEGRVLLKVKVGTTLTNPSDTAFLIQGHHRAAFHSKHPLHLTDGQL